MKNDRRPYEGLAAAAVERIARQIAENSGVVTQLGTARAAPERS